MKAEDLMTTNVVTISEDTDVAEIARVLLENRVSALPVIDAVGKLPGIVSEGDLIRRTEAGTARPQRSWWLALVADPSREAADFVKSHGRHARDVMTRDVITVDEQASAADIAGLLEEKRIKRVPVMRDGQLIGIVSRADLLRVLASIKSAEPVAASKDDRAIRETILAELGQQDWGSETLLSLIVEDGVVHLWGVIRSSEERAALRVLAENAAGVRSVEDHLIEQPIMHWG